MIENTSVMKQGLPESRWTHYRPLRRAAGLAWGLMALMVVLAPSALRAQDSARVMIADTGGVPTEQAREAFAALLAELRARHPQSDLRPDTARAPAEAFVACELSRCRASLMLRWHAFAVLMVRFVAGSGEPAGAPSVEVDVYDAGGQRTGLFTIGLVTGETGSYREALRVGLASLTLPRPTFAPLLVTCDVTDARVFVDDQPLGVVPLSVVRVAPGRHRLHVTAPGYAAHTQTIDVPPEGTRVDLRLTREGGQ